MRAVLLVALCVSCTFPTVTFTDAQAANDAAVEASEGSLPDASEAGDPCDEDNDGFKAQGSCGGGDCNDHDSRVHPGQTFVTDVPDAAPWGDWDCNGTVDYEFPVISSCLTSCSAQGFASSVACGVTASYITCVGTTLCTSADAGVVTQGCK